MVIVPSNAEWPATPAHGHRVRAPVTVHQSAKPAPGLTADPDACAPSVSMIVWIMRFDIETKASPEQERRALTDFTQGRLRIWNRTLDPRTYELREQGTTWAVARESSPGSPFWVVARYDWSDPAVVRWTVVESSYGGGGEGTVRVAPRDDGGSRLQAEWTYTDPCRQKAMLFLFLLLPMNRLISRMWSSALDRVALSQDG